ncbi:uncharacterized protein ZBAI_05542 [Zygosaccharomyces bailii ISA1307]|nr:uncharacterized protein ZBAI_05542 [Zygosaccharomyces bailii ISA1307]
MLRFNSAGNRPCVWSVKAAPRVLSATLNMTPAVLQRSLFRLTHTGSPSLQDKIDLNIPKLSFDAQLPGSLLKLPPRDRKIRALEDEKCHCTILLIKRNCYFPLKIRTPCAEATNAAASHSAMCLPARALHEQRNLYGERFTATN